MFHVKFMYSVLFMWISCENFMSILHETCFTWNSHAAILPKLFVVLLLYCCFSWCYIVTDSAVLLSYFPRRAPPRPSPCLSPGTVSRPSSISCTLTRPQVSQVTHLVCLSYLCTPPVTGNTLVLIPPISVPLQSQVTHLC